MFLDENECWENSNKWYELNVTELNDDHSIQAWTTTNNPQVSNYTQAFEVCNDDTPTNYKMSNYCSVGGIETVLTDQQEKSIFTSEIPVLNGDGIEGVYPEDHDEAGDEIPGEDGGYLLGCMSYTWAFPINNFNTLGSDQNGFFNSCDAGDPDDKFNDIDAISGWGNQFYVNENLTPYSFQKRNGVGIIGGPYAEFCSVKPIPIGQIAPYPGVKYAYTKFDMAYSAGTDEVALSADEDILIIRELGEIRPWLYIPQNDVEYHVGDIIADDLENGYSAVVVYVGKESDIPTWDSNNDIFIDKGADALTGQVAANLGSGLKSKKHYYYSVHRKQHGYWSNSQKYQLTPGNRNLTWLNANTCMEKLDQSGFLEPFDGDPNDVDMDKYTEENSCQIRLVTDTGNADPTITLTIGSKTLDLTRSTLLSNSLPLSGDDSDDTVPSGSDVVIFQTNSKKTRENFTSTQYIFTGGEGDDNSANPSIGIIMGFPDNCRGLYTQNQLFYNNIVGNTSIVPYLSELPSAYHQYRVLFQFRGDYLTAKYASHESSPSGEQEIEIPSSTGGTTTVSVMEYLKKQFDTLWISAHGCSHRGMKFYSWGGMRIKAFAPEDAGLWKHDLNLVILNSCFILNRNYEDKPLISHLKDLEGQTWGVIKVTDSSIISFKYLINGLSDNEASIIESDHLNHSGNERVFRDYASDWNTEVNNGKSFHTQFLGYYSMCSQGFNKNERARYDFMVNFQSDYFQSGVKYNGFQAKTDEERMVMRVCWFLFNGLSNATSDVVQAPMTLPGYDFQKTREYAASQEKIGYFALLWPSGWPSQVGSGGFTTSIFAAPDYTGDPDAVQGGLDKYKIAYAQTNLIEHLAMQQANPQDNSNPRCHVYFIPEE